VQDAVGHGGAGQPADQRAALRTDAAGDGRAEETLLARQGKAVSIAKTEAEVNKINADASKDTANDWRIYADASGMYFQFCTVGNATKGGGTWVTKFTTQV
jgi:hypothetical protein